MPDILYTFRRCPYAMRARLAIALSNQTVNFREIVLQDKPAGMLQISSKGTVPVLQLANGDILDESLDIMAWALEQNDPKACLQGDLHAMLQLIDYNDFNFKNWLDKYKYADRFPEFNARYYREKAEEFISELDEQLSHNAFLFGDKMCLADLAIFPFIRQFSLVDKSWFDNSPYSHLQAWLNHFAQSALFESIMEKHPIWNE